MYVHTYIHIYTRVCVCVCVCVCVSCETMFVYFLPFHEWIQILVSVMSSHFSYSTHCLLVSTQLLWKHWVISLLIIFIFSVHWAHFKLKIYGYPAALSNGNRFHGSWQTLFATFRSRLVGRLFSDSCLRRLPYQSVIEMLELKMLIANGKSKMCHRWIM